MREKEPKRYIWQDDATYKLLRTPKEVEADRLATSYKRGYEMGEQCIVWWDNPPTIADSQVTKFHLDPKEYRRGFTDGFSEAKRKRLSTHGTGKETTSSTEGRDERD